MKPHSCLLCLGSNFDRHTHMEAARNALVSYFHQIRFGTEMDTEAIGNGYLSPFSNQLALLETSLSAEDIRNILKQIEKENGRLPEDKQQGIVKLDIDLLKYDYSILKPKDMEKDFVQAGLKELMV